MNIIVRTCSGKYIVRPDTTWERDSEDFYPPEFIDGLSWVPVLFARISRPGRSVGERFADRYFDGVGYGLLLYPDDLMDGECGLACASCLDHTSFLPFPVKEKTELSSEESAMIESAIEEATRYIYIRPGDIIAIELCGRTPLCRRENGTFSYVSDFQGKTLPEFKIVF